jgi:DNA-directed RNA polymerase specialized sigma24 family protein
MSDAESPRLIESLKLLLSSPTDSHRWADFYRRALPFVLAYGREQLPRSSPVADYEDLGQNVFWLLSRSIHAGTLLEPEGEAQLHALLRTMSRNQAKDMYRARRRMKRDERRQSGLVWDVESGGIDQRPEASLELQEFVEQLMRKLSPFEGSVLQLLAKGFGDVDVLRDLGCSPKKLQRAKQAIRNAARKAQGGEN